MRGHLSRGERHVGVGARIALRDHASAELTAAVAPRIGEQHLGHRQRVQRQKARQQRRMALLVQQVAPDDQVKRPELRAQVRPARLMEGDREQLVEVGVVAQERARQRVEVARGDVGAAALQHKRRQPEPAAHLQDALSGDGEVDHALRHHAARWPHHAKQRPVARREAQPSRCAVRIAELLFVFERAHPEVARAQAHRRRRHRVARQERSSPAVGPPPPCARITQRGRRRRRPDAADVASGRSNRPLRTRPVCGWSGGRSGALVLFFPRGPPQRATWGTTGRAGAATTSSASRGCRCLPAASR